MSSRLLTMKFMQRAAASTPPSTPQSPSQNVETPPSKRQKFSRTSSSEAAPLSEQQLIQAVLGGEDAKREKAIEKLAAEAGETKWVLSTVNAETREEGKGGLLVETATYSDTDQGAWTPATVGRRSFGKFNRELEKHQKGSANDDYPSSAETSYISEEDGEDGGDGGDSDNSEQPAGTEELIPASKKGALKSTNAQSPERKRQRKAEKTELARLAEKRRRKEIKLNGLASISGGGGGGSKPSSGSSAKICYACGEKGHERRDCPQKGKRKNLGSPGHHAQRTKP